MALGGKIVVDVGRFFAPVGLAVLLASTLALLVFHPASAAEYEVPPHHPNIEKIARDTAYLGGNTEGGFGMSADPELRGNLEKRGLRYREGIDDSGSTGMQAMVLQDEKTGRTYIAFRGTWPKGREGTADVIADADSGGDTGSVQYNAHRERLAQWAEKYPGAIVTGHSLGAALGQRYISEHPGAVREGVLFNAPAIAPEHGHRFARAKKQPPVTIYVGKTNVADDTSAPDYDFVSELGGRNHLPAKIVEVTQTEPHSGFANVLLTSHTAPMLSGNAARKIEEIPYEDYQRQREDSWRDAEPLISKGRWGALVADAVTLGAFENAIIDTVQGFGKDGPTPPTSAMVDSGARDCAAAAGYVERARRAIQGRITAGKISDAETNLLFARDRSVGCPDVRARMAGVEGAIGAASEALRGREQTDSLRERIQAALQACDIDALPALKFEVSNSAPDALTNEIALLQMASTAVGQFNDGKAIFDAGNYVKARAPLQRASSAFKALPSGACQTYADRTQDGLDQVDKVLAQQAIVDRALDACDVEDLRTIVTKYEGRTFRFFTESAARIRAALPACEDEPATQEEAIADCRRQAVDKGKVYGTTRFETDGSYSCHTCEKGEVSTGAGCAPDIAAAETDCRSQAIAKGKVYAKTDVHNDGRYDCYWCEQGQIYVKGRCGTVAAHNELACRRDAAKKGKVYAKTVTHKNGKKYDCHWCERGQIYVKGRCGTVAAHNELACRRAATKKGKVYAKTVTHKNGTYDCRWCERGQYYAKGRCYNRQQAQPRPQPQPRPTQRALEPLPCLDGSILGGGCGPSTYEEKTYPCMSRKGRGPFGC